jgi:hypothetical protein
MKKILPIIIVVAVVIGGSAFFAGYKVGQGGSTTNGRMNGFPTDLTGGNIQGFPNGDMGTRNGEGSVSGEIISKDDNSVTVKLKDGGSKIVFYSEATEISKTVDGMVIDLEVGKTVVVSGTTNQDGSITAKTVQLRPVISIPTTYPQP